ncbi:MAG: UDP-N-acetylmuramoyl-tripeptide--D-alanyl-D-alanine ligase [Candidatus Methylacidiphilales bacterium]|nr:UDP-N-acetylmuramoyl-tripeptide--D-alanyl-D-alanine ligase [Candidatus Methylacidiphilales bacterium]
MKPIPFSSLAVWSGGVLAHGQGERTVTRVTTDSRAILPGDLFVALSGERFDGHDYVADAFRQGALAVMVSREIPPSALVAGCGVIRVDDTLRGLQKLATHYRQSLGVRVVAVTGSNGKTSAKEFLSSVLAPLGPVAKTSGNLNNHIGVPLTLLQIDESHHWAVVEMGMNHPGEIRPLVEMARPEIGVITQAGWAHIEHFSDREAIAAEKGEVAYHLPENGFAVLQGDNPRLRALAPRIPVPVAWVGSGPDNTFQISGIVVQPERSSFDVQIGNRIERFTIRVPGSHMAHNAALAVAVAVRLGIAPELIRACLEEACLPKGRMALRKRRSGWIMDDSYNANPDSMAAAFATLMALPGKGRGVALLGSMGELGIRTGELHHWVGAAAADAGIRCLHAIGHGADDLVEGAKSRGMENVSVWNDHESLVRGYLETARDDDRVVVKGSRSAEMEKILPNLEN